MNKPLRSHRPIAAVALALVAGSGLLACGQPSLNTLLVNGPVSNRLNIVFFAEGYTNNQTAQFLDAATSALSALLLGKNTSLPPYQEYRSYFNVYAIFVASRQSGSSHPADRKAADTYFGSTYDMDDRLITMPPSGQAKVDALLSTFLPQCRLPVLLVNDPVPGGSDGFDQTAIASVGPATGETMEILIHETGHVLANLGDEYTNAHPGFPNIEEPDTTRQTQSALIKWRVWMDPHTPVPTPPTAAFTEVIGLFEGAHYHPTGWYRPKFDCAMNHMGVPFCEVCKETLVKAIYQCVRPVESFTPASSRVSLSPTQPAAFTLTVLQPATHSLCAQWFADGLPVAGATNFLFTPPPALCTGGHLISALVQDTTPLVRNDPTGFLSQTVTWTVNGGFSNAVQTVAVSLKACIQGPATSAGSKAIQATLASADIVRALAQASPGANFSPAARLLLVTPSNAAASRFVIRDTLNGTAHDTDVSIYFTNSLIAAVSNSTISSAGRASGTQYALERFSLLSAPLTLDLYGLATTTLSSAGATATVLGTGAVSNAPAVFQGTVTFSPAQSETPAR
jgi:hypothetical protein